MALGHFHQLGQNFIGLADGAKQLGLDIRRFNLRPRADHGGIFRQDQNIGASQSGLGGQTLDAEQKSLEAGRRRDAERGEGEFHRFFVQKMSFFSVSAASPISRQDMKQNRSSRR